MQADLDAALRGAGPTIVEVLAEIIRVYGAHRDEAGDGMELVLA